MKKHYFFTFLLLVFSANYLKAQTLKADVLVIGNSSAAVAAGLQSANSGVNTILLLQSDGFNVSNSFKNLPSGLAAEFLKKMRLAKKISDTTAAVLIDAETANQVLKQWTDSCKNLVVISNVNWVKAHKIGKKWHFKLANGDIINPLVLINTNDVNLNKALKIETDTAKIGANLTYQNTTYRTSIAAGFYNNESTNGIVSMYPFLNPKHDNFIWLNNNQSMLVGQGVGAVAAFAGFFKSKTSLSNLKTIQAELLNFKLNLMPFADVSIFDANWKAIQMVGIEGIIKTEISPTNALFLPNKLVTTQEIKQPLKDFYYKAQIWFDDYKAPLMTIEATIDMICYVGGKAPQSTLKSIEKNWKKTYKFNSPLNLKREITRRELAVLLQDFMPPFNINVDKDGKVLR